MKIFLAIVKEFAISNPILKDYIEKPLKNDVRCKSRNSKKSKRDHRSCRKKVDLIQIIGRNQKIQNKCYFYGCIYIYIMKWWNHVGIF